MKNYLLSICGLLLSLSGMAQTGVSGGLTLIKGFGIDKPYKGFHLGVEIPRDDEVSYFGRFTTTIPNGGSDSLQMTVEANSPNITPVVKTVGYTIADSYTTIEGGTRYYLGSGYDYGWSAYGGSVLMLFINSVKARYSDFDESSYHMQAGYDSKGRVIGFNLGLNGGVKNHFAFGMIYFDMTVTYNLFAMASNELAKSGNYTPITFGFNLGFRKDLY